MSENSQQFSSMMDLHSSPLINMPLDMGVPPALNEMEAMMVRVFREELNSFFGPSLGGVEGPSQDRVRGVPSMTDFGNQIAMTRFIAEVRDAEVVARDIPPSLGSEETVPGGKKSFASGSQRLAALLRYVWHKKHDDGYHAHEVSADRLHLRSLARQVMTLMRADGVNQRFWRDVNGLQKNYYCYKLEALAEGSHTSLSGCMDSWAANLLMQEGFKASRQAETRRQTRSASRSNRSSGAGSSTGSSGSPLAPE